MKRFAIALAVATILIGPVPVWTARWVQDQRSESLQRVSRKTSSLPSCPADGSLRSLLERRSHSSGASLWQPVCLKQEPPGGRVAVVLDQRGEFARCSKELAATEVAQCWFDQPLSFLAEPEARRTIARIAVADDTGRDVVWETTTALAWDRQLQWEHREWIIFVLTFAFASLLLSVSRGKWIEASALQRDLPSVGIHPPSGMERVLLCIMPPFNLPQEIDDLRESYAQLAMQQGRRAANRWYGWQMRHSLLHYLWNWLRRKNFPFN